MIIELIVIKYKEQVNINSKYVYVYTLYYGSTIIGSDIQHFSESEFSLFLFFVLSDINKTAQFKNVIIWL